MLSAGCLVSQSISVASAQVARSSLRPVSLDCAAQVQVVATSEDFQASLDSARPGDVITLQAGAVFRGDFYLPARSDGGSGWITVRSSAIGESLPPDGVRVTPDNAAGMSRLESPNTEPVLSTITTRVIRQSESR